MNLVIDTGAHHPSEAVKKKIQEHARHLAGQCEGIVEECRVQIVPLKHHPLHKSGFIARLDIIMPEGHMVIGDHAGWPSAQNPGVAVDMSFRRAFEVMRQHVRHIRGDAREHKTAKHDEVRAKVHTEAATEVAARQEQS